MSRDVVSRDVVRRDVVRRHFLGLIAGGAALLLLAGGAGATILAAVPIGRMDLPWWRARHEAVLRRIHSGVPVRLVWLGDSITQNWEKHGPPAWQDYAPVWQHFYGDRDAINLGFVGDTTASVLWRLDNGEVAGIAPKAVVLLIGANNLGHLHWGTDDTLAGIAAIVANLRQRVPGAHILLLGILPSDRSDWATQTTLAVNRALAARYASVPGVTFMDLSALFMRDGRLDHDLFYDPKEAVPHPPLHPTAQMQARIAAAIEPTLAAMLGDHPKAPYPGS
jgi:lysophospholipase L1-like esterase